MRGEYGVRMANGDWVEFRISEERAQHLFSNHKDAHELVGNITGKMNSTEWEVIQRHSIRKAA
jgi:hypothetical protein